MGVVAKEAMKFIQIAIFFDSRLAPQTIDFRYAIYDPDIHR